MGQKSKLTIIAEISGVLGLIVAIIFGINAWVSADRKEHNDDTHLVIRNYYDAAMRRDYEEITSFFDFPVVRFYDLTNATKDDIILQQKEYYKRWKFQRIHIVQNSIIIEQRDNGDKKVRLLLDYQTKKNKADAYSNFDLEIVMLLNAKNKIKSIYEMQN